MHIISIFAESHPTIPPLPGEETHRERVVYKGTHLYELGHFNAENLWRELGERLGDGTTPFDPTNKFSLVVSAVTFCHLIDPLGVVAQVMNLLIPEQGYFLVDQLYFLLGKETWDRYHTSEDDAAGPADRFLEAVVGRGVDIQHHRFIAGPEPWKVTDSEELRIRTMESFVMRRRDASPFQFRLTYGPVENHNAAVSAQLKQGKQLRQGGGLYLRYLRA